MKFVFRCPTCERRLASDTNPDGKKIVCPGCQSRLQIGTATSRPSEADVITNDFETDKKAKPALEEDLSPMPLRQFSSRKHGGKKPQQINAAKQTLSQQTNITRLLGVALAVTWISIGLNWLSQPDDYTPIIQANTPTSVESKPTDASRASADGRILGPPPPINSQVVPPAFGNSIASQSRSAQATPQFDLNAIRRSILRVEDRIVTVLTHSEKSQRRFFLATSEQRNADLEPEIRKIGKLVSLSQCGPTSVAILEGNYTGSSVYSMSLNCDRKQTPSFVVGISTSARVNVNRASVNRASVHRVKVAPSQDDSSESIAIDCELPQAEIGIFPGAPCLNADGEMIGFLTKISESGQASMAPLDEISNLLAPRMEVITAKRSGDFVEISGVLRDPIAQTQRIELHVSKELLKLKDAARATQEGEETTHISLQVEADQFSGRIPMTDLKNSAEADWAHFHPVLITKNGQQHTAEAIKLHIPEAVVETEAAWMPNENEQPNKELTTAPIFKKPVPRVLTCAIDFGGISLEPSNPSMRIVGPSNPSLLPSDLDYHSFQNAIFSPDGKSVYISTPEGVVMRFSLPDMVLRAYLDADAHSMAPSPAGIVISCYQASQLRILHPTSLEHIGSIAVSSPTSLASTWTSKRLVAGSRWATQEGRRTRTEAVLIDIEDRRIDKRYGYGSFSLNSDAAEPDFDKLQMTPDSRQVLAGHVWFDIADDVLKVSKNLPLHKISGHYHISSDSKFVTSGKLVYRISDGKIVLQLKKSKCVEFDQNAKRLYELTDTGVNSLDPDGVILEAYELPSRSRGRSSVTTSKVQLLAFPKQPSLLAFTQSGVFLLQVDPSSQGTADAPQPELKQKVTLGSSKPIKFPNAAPDVPVDSTTPNAGGLPHSVLHRMKSATAYLTTDRNSGTGFIVGRVGTDTILATNAHVVGTADKMTAVFFSGTEHETAAEAIVMSVAPDRDLALLQVTTQNLAEPLTLRKEPADPDEKVVVCGFPFGSALALGGNFPEHNFTQGEVTKLLTEDKQTIGIELRGVLNPGNSGGPVMDQAGNVLGIATLSVIGEGIGIAMPAAGVASLMNQPSVSLISNETHRTNQEVTIRIETGFLDLKNQLAEVEILYRKVEDKESELATTEPLDADYKVESFPTGDGQIHELSLPTPSPEAILGPGDLEFYLMQPRLRLVDGKTIHGSTRLVTVMSNRLLEDIKLHGTKAKTIARNRLLAGEEFAVGDVRVTPVKINQDLVPNASWSRDGESLYVLETSGIMRKLSVPGFVEQARTFVDVSGSATGKAAYFPDRSYKHKRNEIWMGPTRHGIAVSLKNRNSVVILDEGNLQQLQRFKIPSPTRFASSSNSGQLLIQAGQGLNRHLVMLDIDSNSAVRITNPPSTMPQVLSMLPNGKEYFGTMRETLQRWRYDSRSEELRLIEKSGVTKPDVSNRENDRYGYFAHTCRGIQASYDSQYLKIDGYIRQSNDLTKPVLNINRVVGLDSSAKTILRSIYSGVQLLDSDGKSIVPVQFLKNEQPQQFLVHPFGGRVMMLVNQGLYWIDYSKVAPPVEPTRVQLSERDPPQSPVRLTSNASTTREAEVSQSSTGQIHAAIVKIVAQGPDGNHTFTGFLAHVDKQSGLIVTTSRVREADSLQVILSAAANRQELSTEHVFTDTKAGFSILRIVAKELPKPLQFADLSIQLQESAPVQVGAALAELEQLNISSLRRDSRGELSMIQLDGAVAAQGIGAPILQPDGSVVGIVTQNFNKVLVAFATPSRRILNAIQGQPESVTVRTIRGQTEIAVSVEVGYVDPLDQVKSVAIRYVETTPTADALRWDQAQLKYVLVGDVQTVEVKTGTALSIGQFRPKGNLPTSVYFVQAEVIRVDGSRVFSDPVRHTVAFEDGRLLVNSLLSPEEWLGTNGPTPPKEELPSNSFLNPSSVQTSESGIRVTKLQLPTRDFEPWSRLSRAEFDWSKNGKHLFALGPEHLYKLTYPAMKPVMRKEVDKEMNGLVLTSEGLVLRKDSEFILLSEESLEIVDSFEILGAKKFRGRRDSSLIVVGTYDSSSRDQLLVFDLSTQRAVAQFPPQTENDAWVMNNNPRLEMSLDGRKIVVQGEFKEKGRSRKAEKQLRIYNVVGDSIKLQRIVKGWDSKGFFLSDSGTEFGMFGHWKFGKNGNASEFCIRDFANTHINKSTVFVRGRRSLSGITFAAGRILAVGSAIRVFDSSGLPIVVGPIAGDSFKSALHPKETAIITGSEGYAYFVEFPKPLSKLGQAE